MLTVPLSPNTAGDTGAATAVSSSLAKVLRDWAEQRAKMDAALLIWQQGLREIGLLNPDVLASFEGMRTRLAKSGYTVALVGEVSRGKSELVNALLFGNEGKRIVPAGAGRTTLCPTEFFCDLNTPPFIELLPIETRLQPTPLAQYKQGGDSKLDLKNAWERHPIAANDADALARELMRVSDTQRISRDEAQRLGLVEDSAKNNTENKSGNKANPASLNTPSALQTDDWVNIPRWRYARINVHNPMLANGLVVLDTPGLNAVGCEHALTYESLPGADAVVLLVSAEAGVTRSDQEIWNDFLATVEPDKKFLLLNKIDALNDGLRTGLHIQAEIAQLHTQANQLLGLAPAQSFVASALQALQARVKMDPVALAASRLPLFERALTKHVHAVWMSSLAKDVGDSAYAQYQSLFAELSDTYGQTLVSLDKTSQLEAKSLDVKALKEQGIAAMELHDTESAQLEQARNAFGDISTRMRQYLSTEPLQAYMDAVEKLSTNSPIPVVKQAVMSLLSALEAQLQLAFRASIELRLRCSQLAKDMSIDLNQVNITQAYALETDSQEWQGHEVLSAVHRLMESTEQMIVPGAGLSRFQSNNMGTVAKGQVQRGLQILKLAQDSGLQWMKNTRQPVEIAAVKRLQSLIKKAHNFERIGSAKQSLAQYKAQLTEQALAEQAVIDALNAAYTKLKNALTRKE